MLKTKDPVVRRMVAYKAHRGLSDEKFARVIGKTKNTVHRWKTGESRAPSELLALALAHLEHTHGLCWKHDDGIILGGEYIRVVPKETVEVLSSIFHGCELRAKSP